MSTLKVLISGAGIAGPVLAYFLSNAINIDTDITIVERSPDLRATGQNIDIRGAAVDVIRRMGLEQTIRDNSTTEEGVAFINSKGESIAEFPASGNTEAQSFTSEFEILRGDLAKILYDSSKDHAKYEFGEFVKSIEEWDNGKVKVDFANDKERDIYDLVIVADGMTSHTRRLVFGRGPDNNDYIKSLGQYMAYYTMPKIDTNDRYARWYNADRGRLIMTRPDNQGTTRTILGITQSDHSQLEKYKKAHEEGPEAQKALLKQEFQDAGWEVERCLAGLEKADDYYFSMTGQVKMDQFVKGHVALLGDAANAPSPISGMGTTIAIVGAYVLAGEISEGLNDIPKALERYQEKLKPLIHKAQKVIPGAPQVANPQTKTGLWVLNTTLRIMSTKIIRDTFSRLVPATSKETWTLPNYSKIL